MYPLDTKMQKLISREHADRLRQDARPASKREPGRPPERRTPRFWPAPNRASV